MRPREPRPFWRSRGVTRLRLESDIVRKQGRYDKGEIYLCFDLSATGRAGQRKRRSLNALPEHFCGSVALRLAVAGTCRVINSGISRRRLNGMLQRGLCPEQSTELDNSEEHH